MLPAFPKILVGREHERKVLFEACKFHQIIYVSGNAGIGKTALISSVIHDLASKQNIPIFYYNIPVIHDVQEFGVIGLQLFSSLSTEKVSSSGSVFDGSLKKNRDFLQKIGTFSGIIFFDNFHNVPFDRMSELLEEICITFFEYQVFITSRTALLLSSFSAPIPYTLELSGLQTNDISQLAQIHHLDNDQSKSLETIARSNGGNPMFIQQAILHLKRGGLLQDILKRSQKEFWDYMYQTLSQNEKLLLHGISWYPFSIPIEAVLFLPVSEKALRSCLKQLHEKKFVYKSEESVYSLHDTLKEFLADKTDSDMKEMCLHAGVSFYIHLFQKRSPMIFSLSVIHHALILEKQMKEDNLLKQFLAEIINISMEFAIEVPYRQLFLRYTELFGFDIDLAARLSSFFVEYMLFDEALSLLEGKNESICLEFHSSSDTAFYGAFLSLYKHIHDAVVRKKYENIIFQNIQFLFETGQADKAVYRFTTMYYMLLWEGELERSENLKQFYEIISKKIVCKEVLLKNDYQRCMFIPLVLKYDNIQYAKNIIASISEHWENSIQNLSQIADIYKVLWDYYRINNEHKNELNLVFQMTRSKILQSDSLHKYGTLMSIVRSFCDFGRLNDALKSLEKIQVEKIQNENIRSSDTDAVLYMYLAASTAQILMGQISKAQATLANTSSSRNPYGYITLVQLHYLLLHLEQRNIHEALKYNRFLFKHFKNDSQNHLKAFNQIMLAKIVLFFKPQKGIEKLLKKVMAIENLRKRFLYIATLLLIEYYLIQNQIEEALKILSPFLEKCTKEQLYWQQYQALEILLKIQWKNEKFQEGFSILKNMEHVWNQLNNNVIPSKLTLYKAACAVQIGKTELAKEILQENLQQVKEFGNEILYPYYLQAMIQVLKIEDKNYQSIQELETEYSHTTLLLSEFYKTELQTFIDLFFPRAIKKNSHKIEEQNIFVELVQNKKEKIIIDKNNLTLRAKEKNIFLDFKKNPKLFLCFITLAENTETVLSYENLFQKIWNIKYSPLLHKANVYVIIQRLRNKLSDENLDDIILTVQDGYKLNQDYQYLFVKKQFLVELNNRQKHFLDSQKAVLTKEEYAQLYQVSLRTAYTDLKELLDSQKIVYFRKGKIIYYQQKI